jgi:hypothetical protein
MHPFPLLGLAALEVVQQRGELFQKIKDRFANRYVKFFVGQIAKEVGPYYVHVYWNIINLVNTHRALHVGTPTSRHIKSGLGFNWHCSRMLAQ